MEEGEVKVSEVERWRRDGGMEGWKGRGGEVEEGEVEDRV